MSKTIIIFAQPKSSRNLLCEILESFPRLRVLNEFFSTYDCADPDTLLFLNKEERIEFSHKFKTNNDTASLIDAITENPKEALELINQLDTRPKVIKIHNHHLSQFKLHFLFDLEDTIFITVKRKNRLKRFVSHMQAGKIQKWFKVDTSDVKILTTAEDFIKEEYKCVTYWEQVNSSLDKLGKNRLKLFYEDDFENLNQLEVLKKLQRYFSENNLTLEIDIKPITFFKQNNRNPKDVIGNWDWVKKNLGFD